MVATGIHTTCFITGLLSNMEQRLGVVPYNLHYTVNLIYTQAIDPVIVMSHYKG